MESTSVLSAFSTRSNCAVRMSSMLAMRGVAVRPDQPRSANATSLHVTAAQRSAAASEGRRPTTCRRDRTGLLDVQRREQAPKAGPGWSAGLATRRERSQQPRSTCFAPGLPRSDQSLPQQRMAGTGSLLVQRPRVRTSSASPASASNQTHATRRPVVFLRHNRRQHALGAVGYSGAGDCSVGA
jgi:hypothetical protein